MWQEAVLHTKEQGWIYKWGKHVNTPTQPTISSLHIPTTTMPLQGISQIQTRDFYKVTKVAL